MGYGVTQPGYWAHRKEPHSKRLTRCYSMKGSHPELPRAFSEQFGAVLHEIGHLLGLSHEQDRPDARDAWYTKNPGALGKKTSLEGAAIREGGGNASGLKLCVTEPSPGDCVAVGASNGWG